MGATIFQAIAVKEAIIGNVTIQDGTAIFSQITAPIAKLTEIESSNGTGVATVGATGITIKAAKDFFLSTANGTRLGSAATQKLGFWGATAVIQQNAIGDPASDTGSNNAAIDSILAVLRIIGLIAT